MTTRATALREARKRWGAKAAVDRRFARPIIPKQNPTKPFCSCHKAGCPSYHAICHIGRISGVGGFNFFSVEASGETWEEAISNLEASERRDRERWAEIMAERKKVKA